MATLTLEQRVKQLQASLPTLEKKIANACENATLRAVEKATELTPPTQNDLRGTNTRSGEMKQHWVTDSRTKPEVYGSKFTTYLANDKEYSSYVNDGHRMDRHFVPGLVINPESGMLEYNPNGKGGIVVGTKTQYVEGLFMEEASHEEYHRIIRTEAARLRRALE